MPSLKTLISADKIAARVAEMGPLIRDAYGPEEIVLVGILRGSVPFMAPVCSGIWS